MKQSNIERFNKKYTVDPISGCWNFKSGINNAGYSMFRYHLNETESKMMSTARASYLMFKGPIPDDMVVIRTCNNKMCANPDHLILGTTKDLFDNKKKNNFKIGNHGSKGRKAPRTTCEHCNKDVAVNIYSKSHGKKCKHKRA